jgi:catalase
VADGLGMPVPAALPRAAEAPANPEVATSAALSLMAFPGDGGIRTRKIAILVADGFEGDSIAALQKALVDAGAVPRLVGVRIGTVQPASGDAVEADASLENTPGVLFDALVLPDGADALARLKRDGHTMEFVKDQYRHGKTILAFGASQALLDKLDIGTTLPSGEADPGLILADAGDDGAADRFIAAVARHRHPERDLDPPMV